MGTDLGGSTARFDPISAHPRNPWLEQTFLSMSTCHPLPNPEELSVHDVSVVKSWDPQETSGNHGFSSNNLGIQGVPVHPFPRN